MKTSYIFQKKITERNDIILHVCELLLMSGLIEDSWSLLAASAFI
jgi:hypothetical protein